MEMLKHKCKDYLKIVLVSYTASEPFYKKFGFDIAKDSHAMYYTNWQ